MGGTADKYRLYLAMYDNDRATARPGQTPRVHWALLLGTKHEDPTSLRKTHCRFHATNRNGYWAFERRPVECVRSPSMLGRVLLGKVEQSELELVDRLLADPRRVRAGDPRWDCWTWVQEALCDLLQRGLVRLVVKEIDFAHLRAYGEYLSAEIVAKGLDRGYEIPVTVVYPGPGPIPSQILK